jgi:hypothetical protein
MNESMKYILTPLLLLFFSFTAFSQEAATVARAATDELAQTYQLSTEQTTDMYDIQLRKYEGLETIASFQSTDEELYYKKLKAVKYNTEVSVKRLLTKSQMEIYYQRLAEKREQNAEVVKQMRSQGATPKEIERKLIEIE